MVFSSLIFMCVFLPAALIAYNLSKNITYKNIILAVTSLIFYAWGEPVYVILLVISALTDYIHGLIIDRFYATPLATVSMASSVIINLGMLAVFKYSGVITENLNSFAGISLPIPRLSLPIGISFYTFQTLSYTIDLYRGKIHVQKSLLKFLVYVSMFPQLVAGPIIRYSDIAPSLSERSVSLDDFAYGAKRFTAGLLKKLALANTSGNVAAMLLEGTTRPTVVSSWLGIVMFTFQIYFDFSGYSDMAIGLGRMLGFKFRENFDYPYIAKNITEFWRRWHISLSSFFRDYVYIPLGGNRYAFIRNLLIVWILTGIWHGAGLNFMLWGMFYGIALLIEKKFFKGRLRKIPSPLCYIYTMAIVIFGWAIFYFTDINTLLTFMKNAFGGAPLYDLTAISALYTNLWLIILCSVASTPVPKVIFNYLCKKYEKFALAAEPTLVFAGLALCFILLVGQTYNPFLYFRF